MIHRTIEPIGSVGDGRFDLGKGGSYLGSALIVMPNCRAIREAEKIPLIICRPKILFIDKACCRPVSLEGRHHMTHFRGILYGFRNRSPPSRSRGVMMSRTSTSS
jgi:hypothetical protein